MPLLVSTSVAVPFDVANCLKPVDFIVGVLDEASVGADGNDKLQHSASPKNSVAMVLCQ
jgi:hypothetical protein